MATVTSLVCNIELRKFGLISATIVAVLFGLLLPWLTSSNIQLWPWYLAGLLALVGLFWPSSLIIPYCVWLKFGRVAGWINTRILLFLLFYFIFFPVGLIMKLVVNDPMQRKIDPQETTYRVVSSVRNRNHLEKPY